MARKDSQNAKIYRHLTMWGSITPLEALRDYGCMRLASRIHDIKERYGADITTTIIREDGSSWARYDLHRPWYAVIRPYDDPNDTSDGDYSFEEAQKILEMNKECIYYRDAYIVEMDDQFGRWGNEQFANYTPKGAER